MKNIKKIGLGLGVLGLGALSLASCGSNTGSSTAINTKTTSALSDKKIVCYTRDTSSGTRDGFFTGISFKDAVKSNAGLVAGYQEVNSNGDMITSIKNDENGIGYISLSSLSESGLKGLYYNDVEPTEENVLAGTYKLTRNFNYITRDDDSDLASGKIVRALVAYLGTVEGKTLVKNNSGIVNVSPSDPTWESIKDQYSICNEDNSSTTIVIAGSTSVKSITAKLVPAFSQLCGNFKYTFAQNGSGDAYKRTQGSEKDGSNRADLAFASREFDLTNTEKATSGTYGKMCTDAIVAVVNTKNSYSKTTSDALKNIYSGVTTKWNELN